MKELILIISLIITQAKVLHKYFIHFKSPLIIYNDIKNGRLSLQKEEKNQEQFKLELNEILKVNPNYKSEDQTSAIKNIKKTLQWTEKSY